MLRLVGLLLLSAVVASSAPGGRVTTVEREVAIEAERVVGLTVRCPAGSAAVSGGLARGEEGLVVLRSSAAGERAWRVELLAPFGTPSGVAQLSSTCVRGVRVRTVRTTVRTTERRSLPLRCPSGTRPASFGWAFRAEPDAFTGQLGWIVRRAVPTRTGWSVTVADLAATGGSPSAPLTVVARCVAGIRPFVRVTSRVRVRAGTTDVVRRCVAGDAIGGGASLGGSGFVESVTITPARAARLRISTQFATAVRAHLVCVRGR